MPTAIRVFLHPEAGHAASSGVDDERRPASRVNRGGGMELDGSGEEPEWEIQTMANTEEHGKLRFLDSFVGIFRRKTEPEESQAEPSQSFEDVRARFDTA